MGKKPLVNFNACDDFFCLGGKVSHCGSSNANSADEWC